MRYLKLASAKNPDNDFIELNDFNGFLCTSFQSLGINRKLEFLAIKNRQFVVDNKPSFNKYNLTIEIMSKYSEYEVLYRKLITFLDKNKKSGFRLYYRPYENDERGIMYCLCDIETFTKTEKRQPIVLSLSQNSLWLRKENKSSTEFIETQKENLFEFKDDGDGYYSVSFSLDQETNSYCVEFYSNASTEAIIVNNGFNEIPLNIRIYGHCVNPIVSLFRKGEDKPIRETKIVATISNGYYVEINSEILKNGVYYVNNNTNEKIDYSEVVDNELGSPYFYIENGEYLIKVVDGDNNICNADIFYQEEYSG